MAPLDYALLVISLWILAMTGALFAWRALYRVYSRWKDEQDRQEALARIEEQERRIVASWTTTKNEKR